MRIAIMGSGGVGGYYGGRLARAGEEVTFIARGSHLQAMRERGLRVEGRVESFTLPQVRATDDPTEAGPMELVLVAVKDYDLAATARAIQPMVGPATTVIPLLNGVDAAERIGAVVGMTRVMGGAAYVSSAIAEPGVIRQVSPFDRIRFGELAGGTSARGKAIEAVFREAGIDAVCLEDIAQELWSKFLFIAAASGTTALTGATLGPVLHDPDTRALFIGCLDEVFALARGKGVALKEKIREETLAFVDGLPPGMKPSMLLDLEMGRPLELEALAGTAARLGRELGIPTPVNQFIYAALKHRANGRH